MNKLIRNIAASFVFSIGTGILILSCASQKGSPDLQNKIVAENQLAGTTDWIIDVKYDTCSPPNHRFCRRRQIEGYCSKTSVSVNDTIDFYVSTDTALQYSLDIYRMGYYGGKGGNLKRHIGPLNGKKQADPKPDPQSNFFESNWESSHQLVIPEDWVSGVYVCKLTTM